MPAMQSLLLLVVFLNLISGLYVLSRDTKDWNNRLFCLTSMLVSLWTFANYLSGVMPTALAIELSYATGALVIGSVLIWILYVADGYVARRVLWGIVGAALGLALLSFVPHFLVTEYEAIYIGGVFVGTPAFGLFFYSALFCIAGCFVMYKTYSAYRREGDLKRKSQLRAVLFGAGATFIISGLTSFILPSLSIFVLSGWDSIGVLIFELAVGYTIVKHNFFNIQIIRTEVLIVTLWVAILLRTFFATSVMDVLASLLLLIVGVAVGLALRASALEEIANRKKLAELNELKDEFLSFASHQLRSPLTVIAGYASMIKNGEAGPVSPKQKEIIGSMFDATNNLTRLVEDFLNISRIDQGGLQYVYEECDVDGLIADVVETMQVVADTRRLTLSYTRQQTPVLITADEDKLRQVFLNIIDNALKYTIEGGVQVVVVREGAGALVSVVDTGSGLTPDLYESIFDKFTRARNGKLAVNGSGIGLYLAKQVVEAHKGRISVVSEGLDKGSTFSVWIPFVLS